MTAECLDTDGVLFDFRGAAGDFEFADVAEEVFELFAPGEGLTFEDAGECLFPFLSRRRLGPVHLWFLREYRNPQRVAATVARPRGHFYSPTVHDLIGKRSSLWVLEGVP